MISLINNENNKIDFIVMKSVLMYLFSFMIILNTTLLLRNYLLLLTEKEKNEMPKYINLNQWKRYEYLGWLFTIITFLFISLGLSGDIMYIFNLLIK